ncbi:MAG: preprotein translocase subunit YajC [Bacteroidales bacterium]|nr:preprotein translocase subunit YajC [Bacteroidales bacterium]
MNILTVVLQEAPQQAPAGGGYSFIIMMVAIFAIMYFLMILPQKKRQKQIQQFRNSLSKGDKIVTVGGIYGTVDEIHENYVIIVVDSNVRIRVAKNSIVKDYSEVQQ